MRRFLQNKPPKNSFRFTALEEENYFYIANTLWGF